jgi:1,2-dihydroxy-3-keto-5-methylthiopentene dioxygenase
VSASALRALGVLAWHLPPGAPGSAARLAAVRAARGYSFEDAVRVSASAMTPEAYAAKRAIFYAEHIHADEEVRYVTGGGGYFDIRSAASADAPWIRMHTRPGDMIVLPAGAFHRFTPDSGDDVAATRLFVGAPEWTPIGRGEGAEEHAARVAYVAAVAEGTLGA